MSLPSAAKHLADLGVVELGLATPEQLHEAIIRACREDLPLGMDHLTRQAVECRECGSRLRRDHDPNSSLGKQLTRLCAGTQLRTHVEQEFGVSIGFYNCCSPVLVPTGGDLEMSDVEQIELQNGDQKSADC